MPLQIHADSQFYLLHVDGVGEYASRRQDGLRCLFVFTSEKAISDFVELMEMPEYKQFTAIAFDLGQFIGFLAETLAQFQMVAINPPANCEFSPIEIKHFLDVLRSQDL